MGANPSSGQTWPVVNLGELGELRNGLNFSRDQEGLGIPVLKVKDFGTRSLAPVVGYDELDATKVNIPQDQILRFGDTVVIRSNGNMDLVGRSLFVGFAPERPLTFSGFCIRFRPHFSKVDPRFIAFVIRSPIFRARFTSFGSGTGIQNINQQILFESQVSIPPLGVQRAIAQILGTLDDKIELNQQMNETLEAMSRALFKSWFVDFDPVRAKAAGRQPAGMDAATAKLFPDAFEMSELGEIPRGWAWGTLGAVSHLNPESWTANNRPSEIKYVDLSNTKWGRIESTSRYVWSEAPSRAQRILRVGDTIFGVVRPGNGSFALVRQSGLTGSTGFAVLRSKSALHAPFVYLAATARENVDRLSHLADGAAYPAIRPDQLLDTPIIQTHAKVLDAFGGKAELYLAKMAANDMQAESLSALRDTLLPPLLSGELSIPDAERFVGRAV